MNLHWVFDSKTPIISKLIIFANEFIILLLINYIDPKRDTRKIEKNK